MTKPRKLLFHDRDLSPADDAAWDKKWRRHAFRFDDKTWTRLTGHIPGFPGIENGLNTNSPLRSEIENACRWLLVRDEMDREGGALALVMRGGQSAPMEQYAKFLRKAVEAWKKMQDAGYEPAIGGEQVVALAAAAEQLVAELRLAEPMELPPPWPIFVFTVADALHGHFFDAEWNGRVYEGARPAWFQAFMWELNEVLPAHVRRRQLSNEAFATSVAAAMRGAVFGFWGSPLKKTPDV